MNAPAQRGSANYENYRNACILVVEDNADHAVIIDKAIQQTMPDVKRTIVSTEEEAIAHLDTCLTQEMEVPKLILLDLYLPDRKNGWQLLDRIKAMPAALSKIPVVLLTYSDNRTDIAESYQRGCASYLIKPSTFDDWLYYFQTLRAYWWETATLPKNQIALF